MKNKGDVTFEGLLKVFVGIILAWILILIIFRFFVPCCPKPAFSPQVAAPVPKPKPAPKPKRYVVHPPKRYIKRPCPAQPKQCPKRIVPPPSENFVPKNKIISPDGRLKAIGYVDGTIKIYRMSDHYLIWQSSKYTIEQNTITSLAFSQDNYYLVSLDADGTLILWPVDKRSYLYEPWQVGEAPPLSRIEFISDQELEVNYKGEQTIYEISPNN